MNRAILSCHIQDGGGRRSLVVSLAGHVLLLAFFLTLASLLPAPEVIVIGSGPGGGRGGEVVTVGLAADPGGGAGFYKPSLTPQPEAVPPPEPEPVATAADSTRPAFEEVVPQKEAKAETPAAPRHPPKKEEKTEPKPGQIPREPEPGAGGASTGSAGRGDGLGTGSGVQIGSGSGQEGSIDSWYVRQVEQRIGQNWLRSSLGQPGRPLQAVASFEIRPDGQITDIQIEEKSGAASVDLAVLRAIQASNPLPRPPYEFQGRRIRFRAVFEYPPR